MSAQSVSKIDDKDKSDGELGTSIVVASDEEQSTRRPRPPVSSGGDCKSSSSSEDEEGFASPPPNKRRKYKHRVITDPRIEGLISQVGYISGYLQQTLPLMRSHNQVSDAWNLPGPSNEVQQSEFLVNPCNSNQLTLGELNTDFDEKRVVPPAKRERLMKLMNLQHFDSQAWKGLRYKSTLQSYIATPGFAQLKVNEEFCHLNKTKDFLASAEGVLAGLTNAELEQQELLKQGLQELLNWAAVNPKELNPNSLFEKITSILGPGSPLHKCSENIMQIICGRRGEAIEIRRERIIKELNNPNLKAILRGIPPNSEYLFGPMALQPVISSLGGTQSWLNKPDYIKEGRVNRAPVNRLDKKQNFNYKRTRFNNKQLSVQTPQKRHNFRRNQSKGRNPDHTSKQD